MGRWPEDPELEAKARAQASVWRAACEAQNDERARLNRVIIELHGAGYGYDRIKAVTGIKSTWTIQGILGKGKT